ncbi:MAG: methylated-DNA--[protein]-cysteine S-methyltransferase [Promethearchaeia archaeon]
MCVKKEFIFFYTNYLEAYITIFFTRKDKFPIPEPNITLNRIKFFKKKKALLQYGKDHNIRYKKIEAFKKNHPVQILYNLLHSYFSGERINLSSKMDESNLDLAINEQYSTPFQKRVIYYLKNNIGYGTLISYSDIGEEINSKAYQAIGSVIKRNPYPLIIPCHRVVRKNGEIGGFIGKTGEGWQVEIKKRLISLEKN